MTKKIADPVDDRTLGHRTDLVLSDCRNCGMILEHDHRGWLHLRSQRLECDPRHTGEEN